MQSPKCGNLNEPLDKAGRADAAPADDGRSVNATGTLRRVLLRPPRADELGDWEEYGWRDEPDPDAIAAEHAELCALLSDAGAEVVLADEPVPGDPDAIYAYDPVLIGPARRDPAARSASRAARRRRRRWSPRSTAAGVPIAGRMEAPATADGGDMFWLDERTLLVGRGYRTNNAGIADDPQAASVRGRDRVRPPAPARPRRRFCI